MTSTKTLLRSLAVMTAALVLGTGLLTASPALAASGTIVDSETPVSPAYPRVVRTDDGNLLATFSRRTFPGEVEQDYKLFRSTDDGDSWSVLDTITDYHGLDLTELVAPTLYVLPQTIGSYAAGTVFLGFTYRASSATVGSVQIFRSTDNGATWTWHGQTGFDKYYHSWEPEFGTDSTGHLVVYYSDESQPGYNQAVVREISS